MLINLRNQSSSQSVRLNVDPSIYTDSKQTLEPVSTDFQLPHSFNWEGAFDEDGHLCRCPACGCRELFARRDFPQKTGMAIVVLGATLATIAFAVGYTLWAFVALGSMALIDAAIFPFTKKCLVCYRCRSEFRRLPIRRDHSAWDLATGEKYRHRSS